MPDRSIEVLVAELQRRYGDRIIPYGGGFVSTSSVCFRLRGIPAVFSILTLDGTLPFGRFDVQIERCPPGDDVWADEYDLHELLQVIANIERDIWPK